VHGEHGVLHEVGRRVVVHHGIAQHLGHPLDAQLRHVAVVTAVEHPEQRLVRVEPQLLQDVHAQPVRRKTRLSELLWEQAARTTGVCCFMGENLTGRRPVGSIADSLRHIAHPLTLTLWGVGYL